MEQEINIAALLKDCPKGTKLYSPVCGECEFTEIDNANIIQVCKGREKYGFYSDGKKWDDGECLLFPSKEVRDWGCFNAKYVKAQEGKGREIAELLAKNGAKDGYEERAYEYSGYIYFIDSITKQVRCNSSYNQILLSTGTELKLEEEPKFQFKPFDRVVVRNFNPENEASKLATDCYWFAAYFSHYNKKNTECPYVCTCNDSFPQCLPYNEQTAKLIGTTDDYNED